VLTDPTLPMTLSAIFGAGTVVTAVAALHDRRRDGNRRPKPRPVPRRER
jgi:hypothetical protein